MTAPMSSGGAVVLVLVVSPAVNHMSPLSILMLSLAMSTDAFAAAVGKGAALHRPRFAEALRTGVIFGVVEALTPLVGWLLGTAAAPYVRASVSLASLDTLIRTATGIDGVAFVSPWYPTHTMNSGAVGAIQGNSTAACGGSGTVCGPTPIWDHGILGSGQIAGIADSGTTPNAAWFTTLDKGAGPHEEVTFTDDPPPVLPNVGSLHPDNKILGYWLQPGGPTDYDYTSGHGTHTTGTIVGDAAGTFGADTYLASTPSAVNHELADGMAPNAQLLFQDIGPDDPRSVIIIDFEGTLDQSYAGGARIHSDSWGAGTSGQYTSDDANADTLDSEIKVTLPANASATHYVVVRDYAYANAKFTVELEGTPATPVWASCNVDADCKAVPANGCCHNGRMEAVNKKHVKDYTSSFTCPQTNPICPMYIMLDTRQPECNNNTHTCEMVAIDDIACGAHSVNSHQCPDGYDCDAPGTDAAGHCVEPDAGPQACGGIAGLACPAGQTCVDNTSDSCDPAHGGADCPGVCVTGGQFCGGIAGIKCPSGLTCVDNPNDSCDPKHGGADCGGICQ